jgi:hypothetical protein
VALILCGRPVFPIRTFAAGLGGAESLAAGCMKLSESQPLCERDFPNCQRISHILGALAPAGSVDVCPYRQGHREPPLHRLYVRLDLSQISMALVNICLELRSASR